MQRLDLNGTYQLQSLEHQASIAHMLAPEFVPEGWLDSHVPEDVRTVLRRNGLITGHYYGKDVDAERWIDDQDWVYYRTFYADGSLTGARHALHFEGIDTLAEIYLNGVRIGDCENMHIRHSFDVTGHLVCGGLNRLIVRVLSPIRTIEHMDRTGLYPQEDTSRLLIRKSQMNYGWDFSGHCLTTGIWKDVYLESRTHERLEDVFLATEKLEDGQAFLRLQLSASGSDEGYEVEFSMMYEDRPVLTTAGSVKEMADCRLTVVDPHLWWPRPYGRADLYQVRATLKYNGESVDEQRFSFGIRTVELRQDPLPDGGRTFIFVVNGKPIFVRGANWVPANAVYAEIQDRDYDFYIREAVQANLSMLRIWGGGIYESDYFFDLCDRNGIMIFQDFMLACGIYPQDDRFLALVHREAVQIVRKYRNRASLVMWSGDNEVDQAYWWYDLQDHFQENKVNRIAVAEAVRETDPTRPFLVSSPGSPFTEEVGGDDPNSPVQGDMHIYLTRFHPESEYYYKKLTEFVPRFMSEYGFSSLPGKDTYGKFNFYKQPLHVERNPWLGELAHLEQLGEQQAYDELIYATQYTHAQALKYWIEYMRSFKWTCGGTLYWKFNDPVAPNRPDMLFPTLMSAVDFYGKRKMAFYYSKRAYEDIILAFREDQAGNLTIAACNETEHAYTGNLRLSLWDYQGQTDVIWDKWCKIFQDSADVLATFTKEEIEGFASRHAYLKAEFLSDSLQLDNRYPFQEIAQFLQVKLPETKLSVTASTRDGHIEIAIATQRYAQDVRLDLFPMHEQAEFTDNCFDLDAGSKRIVRMTDFAGDLKEARLRVKAHNSPAVILDLCELLF